ncbi:acyltransferase family protein [Soonwooa sp.]|uniref:acyltransferase family protein n=1 Tax=Soonwooa sp. TaxID=1938592 RepID=UPI0028A1A2B2|nr:acyltransferase family protein [Soonwooa sp.]
MEQSQKENYNWIDAAKLLSIFLVVLFHTEIHFGDFLNRTLSMIRMPMFFFLSGLLFSFKKNISFKNFASRRAKQLLIPYFWFFIIFYIYWLVIGKTEDSSDAVFYKPIIEYALGKPMSFNIVMWFIPCLYIIQCLYFLIFKNLPSNIKVILLYGLSIIPYFINLDNYPYSLDRVFIGILFYGISSTFSKDIINFITSSNHTKYIAILLSIIISILISFYIFTSPSSIITYTLELVNSFLFIFLIMTFINWLMKANGKVKWIKYMSQNAIIILALHTYSNMFLFKIADYLGIEPLSNAQQILYNLVISLSTLLLMYIPIYLINRFAPFILGRSFKIKTTL